MPETAQEPAQLSLSPGTFLGALVLLVLSGVLVKLITEALLADERPAP